MLAMSLALKVGLDLKPVLPANVITKSAAKKNALIPHELGCLKRFLKVMSILSMILLGFMMKINIISANIPAYMSQVSHF